MVLLLKKGTLAQLQQQPVLQGSATSEAGSARSVEWWKN